MSGNSEKCAEQYRNGDKCLYEGVIIVQMALYATETWGMRSAESK